MRCLQETEYNMLPLKWSLFNKMFKHGISLLWSELRYLQQKQNTIIMAVTNKTIAIDDHYHMSCSFNCHKLEIVDIIFSHIASNLPIRQESHITAGETTSNASIFII